MAAAAAMFSSQHQHPDLEMCMAVGKAVTRGVLWVFEHPRNFREKLDTQKQIYYKSLNFQKWPLDIHDIPMSLVVTNNGISVL